MIPCLRHLIIPELSRTIVSGLRKMVVSKRVVLADVPGHPKPEQATKKRHSAKNRSEGTRNRTMVPKTGTRAHSPKLPFYKTALVFP